MANPPVSRRSFLRHIPLAAAAAGTFVSSAAIAAPLMVKVGSPSFSIPPETADIIARWNKAHDEHALAWRAYDEWNRVTPPWRRGEPAPAAEAYMASSADVTAIEGELHRALRKTSLDLVALYKGA